ncbi:MAG: type II toxin-antitoxin system RelE/ParE family toxin [Terriglobales bacterium]
MVWEVEFTGQFETWWNSLSEDEQVEISAKVELLQERGPTLPRPHADVISASRHANMKELRGKVEDRHLRVLYAFDPRRTALLLLSGATRPAIQTGTRSLCRLPTICSISI